MNHNEIDNSIILKNGIVYTVDKEKSWAEAIVIEGKKIAFVGTNKEVKKYINNKSKVIDLNNKFVLPGFFDCHSHPSLSSYMVDGVGVNLRDCLSIEDAVKEIKKFADENPDAETIYGFGWLYLLFDDKGPRKEMIDEVVSDRPVCMYCESFHSIWVNSKAIEMAGVGCDTEEVDGGVIERDSVTREPLGTFRETAMSVITNKIPQISVDRLKTGIKYHMELAGANGITTACDSWLTLGSTAIETYKSLDNENQLTVRYRGMVALPEGRSEDAISMMGALKKEFQEKGRLFQNTTVKIFVDGVIEEFTAYLKEPYLNMGEFCGRCKWYSDEDLMTTIAAYARENMQIHAHVIGDEAAKLVIEAISKAQNEVGKNDVRHTLAHIELLDPNDIHLMKEQELMGCINSFWHSKDQAGYFERFYETPLGKERANSQYPQKSLFDAGIICSNGSDYVISPPKPLEGIQVGMNRRKVGRPEVCTLDEKERGTLEQMIETFTINGAYMNHMETETGSIEVGKKADIVVLEENLFEVSNEKIHEVNVEMTILEGKIVYCR